MAIADTTVIWATSELPGAPVLAGVPGSYIALLDALLINGHTPRPADSVVVADGLATFHLSAGNPYPQHGVLQASGGPAALNRRWRVHTSAQNSLAVVVDDTVPPGTYAGVSLKAAPAGWQKVFADVAGHRAVYRSADLASTGLCLYIDDSDARYARVRGYESASHIDTREIPFPTEAQAALEAYIWVKSNVAGAAQTRPWAFSADSRHLRLCPQAWATYAGRAALYRFGDLAAFSSADAHCCEIAAGASTSTGSPGQYLSSTTVSNSTGLYLARAVSGAVGAINVRQVAVAGAGDIATAPVDGRLHYVEVFAYNGSTNTALRARVPGVFFAVERLPGVSNFAIDDADGLKLLRVAVDNVADCYIGLQIQGPV